MSDDPSLPYAGTEGWSGSDTSRERAYREAGDGSVSQRQRDTLDFLLGCEGYGATWSEVASRLHLHHGQASGSLSALHLEGRIARLTERRDRSQVYVLPQYVGDRETVPHKSNVPRVDPHAVWQDGHDAGYSDARQGTYTANPYPQP